MTTSVWRKRVKVIGLVLSVMMLALWVFSVMFRSIYVPPSGEWAIGMGYGLMLFFEDWHEALPGWTCKFREQGEAWTGLVHRFFFFELAGYYGAIFLPVWLLVVATGFPTAFLWWRDRRRPKVGFCKVCKYDLTGNLSGICPECGASLTPDKVPQK